MVERILIILELKKKDIKLIEFLWTNYKEFSIIDLLDNNYGYGHIMMILNKLESKNIIWPLDTPGTYQFNPKATDNHIYNLLGIDLQIEKRMFLNQHDSNEYVYVYYYQTYQSNALTNEVPVFPCKIGSTTHGLPLLRCVEQLNTSTPEPPTIALLIKCTNAEKIERFLHAQLKANNRHLDHFFNQEWFNTNPIEVENMLSHFTLANSA